MADNMDPKQPIYVISIAAELAGVHPQTLRVYERKGLVAPKRTAGNSRRYSENDISILRRIQELTNEGINLAGVIRVLELEHEIARLNQALGMRDSSSMVPLRDVRRVRRALKTDTIEQLTRRRTFPSPPVGGDR